ncbi:Uu.00g113840.m01.CDS01 [Anthostomella pinea]|uniref:Uu.00g113840.m01.CDS01 n=1 Tax=Anthostomella pinea TaxID=933095 RepID=A0AAI8YGH6_9PEZI|nr:Uu.00g113840.m01.CDS01 [Anthostomella pinea]
MKTFNTIAALLPAAVLGAAVPRAAEYSVTDFSAACIAHSTYCALNFNVTTSAGAPTVTCSFFGPGPDYLPAIPLSGCSDPSVSFSFAPAADKSAFPLTVVSAAGPGTNLTGTYVIPGADVTLDNNGAVVDERYIGGAEFVITDLTTIPA